MKLMKKKFAVILLSVSLGVSVLNGCGDTQKGRNQNAVQEQKKEDALRGEVSKITQDSITIKVDSTGEEQELTITEDTVIKRQSMGGGMGQKPEGGELPERPEGQQGSENGEPPEKPEGQPGSENGEPPERPEGDMPDGQKPDMENASEEIALSDISEGDTVMVIAAEDGSAVEVMVMPKMEEHEEDSLKQPAQTTVRTEYPKENCFGFRKV